MANKTTFSIPTEAATQLRALADHNRLSVAATIGKLISDACSAAKITTDDAPVSVIYNVDGDETRIEAEFFGEWRVMLTQKEAIGFAERLEKVATRGGTIVDLDLDPSVSFSRQGSAVVMEEFASVRVPPFRRTMAPYVALAIVKELREAVDQA